MRGFVWGCETRLTVKWGVAALVAIVAALLATAIAPAAASAATQTIPGTGFGPLGHNLTIYVGDNGQLQAKSGAPGDPVQGMFFGSDTGPASQHNHLRLKGAPAPDTTITDDFEPVSNGPVTGNGTPSSPFENVTVMRAVQDGMSLFRIKQTVLYTAFNQSFRVVWEVTNIDPQRRTIPFIWGTSADLYIDSDDSGTGVFIDGASRFVGGTNEVSRTTGGIQEVTSSRLPGESTPAPIPRWASYEESRYSEAINRLNDNDAFRNSIVAANIDNGAGVSFDDRAQSGLGPDQTQRYEVVWHNRRPTPLTATPANASRELPDSHEVTLSLVDANFNPLPGQRIIYEIAGVNPTNAPRQMTTNQSGQAVVSWDGTTPGVDTLTAYADADGDGNRDPEEPASSATVSWLADNHVDGPPQVPGEIAGPSGQLPIQVQPNPDNPEAPYYQVGRSASSQAGFGECTFDQRSGRALNLPVTSTLEPGGGTISNVGLYLVDPGRHDPVSGASLPERIEASGNSGNSYSFTIPCVVNGEMWLEFTLTEGGVDQTFRIPIGGLQLIDPQGVVHDGARYDEAIGAGQSPEQARATAAIAGATVRLQRRVDGEFVNVLSGDPGITPNLNPQTTGDNGVYQWDVAAGDYRVVVYKSGFGKTISSGVTIPPPVLDLHIRLDRFGTTVTGGPTGGTNERTPTFTYEANDDVGATFVCSVDAGPAETCNGGSFTTSQLGFGAHTFSVQATDSEGFVEPNPATRSFTVTDPSPEPEPTPEPEPDPEPDPEADIAVTGVDVDTKKKQKLKGKALKIKTKVAAQDEDVEAKASGEIKIQGKKGGKKKGGKRLATIAAKKVNLTKPEKSIDVGEATVLRQKVKGKKKPVKKATRKIKRALKKGKKVRAKITIAVTDDAGNTLRVKRTVQITASRKKKGGKKK